MFVTRKKFDELELRVRNLQNDRMADVHQMKKLSARLEAYKAKLRKQGL